VTVVAEATWAGLMVTTDATGALAAAEVGPVGALYVNGVVNAAVVTMAGVNPYSWSVTLPALADGDCVTMYITATVDGVARAWVVAEEVASTVYLSSRATAAAVWAVLTATLTTVGSVGKHIVDYLDARVSTIGSAVAASSSVAATDLLDMVRWVTYAQTVSALTIPATWAKVYLTLKVSAEKDTDAQAVLQVVATNGGAVDDGVLRLEGAAPTSYTGVTAASGSLAVDQAAGTVGIALSDDLTGAMLTRTGLGWDLKCERADGTTVLLSYGSVRTRATETRAL
jgi:hypothetical protein